MGTGHDHDHASANFDQAFIIGIVLNLAFVGIEVFYGWRINSLALLADASHNLSDVAGLVLAWAGALAGKFRPNPRHTYGWKKGSILAASANALLLLMAMGALVWEAANRLLAPEAQAAPEGMTIMAVAAVGIVVNTATALLFMREREHDLNIRGAFLHMAADALVSLGVVIAGGLALWLDWNWIDPVVSLLIAAVILVGTWNLFRQSLHLLFDGVPEQIDFHAVRNCLLELPGVERVHDLHIWAMGSSHIALTAHLEMPAGSPEDAFYQQANELLHERFDINHVTLQVMREPLPQHCN